MQSYKPHRLIQYWHGHQDYVQILCCASVYARQCHETSSACDGRRLGCETLRPTSAPQSLRKTTLVIHVYKVWWPLAGKTEWRSDDSSDNQTVSGPSWPSSAFHVEQQGLQLGDAGEAGVLGAFRSLIWLWHWVSAGQWWGMAHAFSDLQCLPLWDERLGLSGHWAPYGSNMLWLLLHRMS